MADTGKAMMGKHAALWERMRAKKGPQMIHRSKPTEAIKEIPMSITMSPESTQEDELRRTQVIDDALVMDPSTWAMMDYGAAEENQQLDRSYEQREAQGMASFLGTSFVSASTQDDTVVKQYGNVENVGTPMQKSDFANDLTPGVCWKKWQEEEVREGDFCLLQESMISDESPFVATPQNQTALSVASLAPMTPGMSLTTSPTTPLTAMRRNSAHQALEESNVYVRRIHELEEALRSAHANGFSSPSLERNKTLVKEVRFAEQTCVELSQRNAALEQEVERLELHLQETRKENECLHEEIVQSSRECATLVAHKEALEVALEQERSQREADFEFSQAQLLESQTLVCDLRRLLLQKLEHENQQLRAGDENREPNVTPKKPAHSSSSGSPTSQVLAKTLQTQLERGYSDSDKILELDGKLTESQKALSEARRELESLKARERDRSALLEAETSNCSMSTELELARSQAKLASVSKELQVLRVAESSARLALSQAKVQLSILQNKKDDPEFDNAQSEGAHQQEIAELKSTVQKLTQDCRSHEESALRASNRVTALEQELVQSREQAALERERLQEEFFDMTQRALGNVEWQSRLLDHKIKQRTEQFSSRLHSMSSALHLLQNSLDFQSELSSCIEEDEHTLDSLSRSDESVNGGQGGSEQGSTDGTVLNATIHPSPSATQSMHEEMLLEQMEEARLVDRSADCSGHENIEGLSLIQDLSHLYDDFSALLSNDFMSPVRESETTLQKSPQDVKSEASTSIGEKSTVQSSIDSVEVDCLRLRSILERTQIAASGGNHVLLETIEDQSKVIQSLERKLTVLADEAGKIEYERTQLNSAVSEMSYAYDRCQSELRETSAALKASQEAEERSDIQHTLEKLLQKLQEKERSIDVLRSEKEVLASKVRELSDSSGEAILLNKVEIATGQVDKLQREIGGMAREVEKERLRCVELSNKIESLESLRKKDERRIAEMREAAVRSESETLERDEQLDRLKAEREDAYRTSQELLKSVEELTNSKAELSAEVEQLQRALFALEGELEHLKVSYITCNDKLADASEQNTNKDAIVAQFRTANRVAKEMVATTEECLAQAKADLEDSETERKYLEERVAALEGELGATTARDAMLVNKVEIATSQVDKLQQEIEGKARDVEKERRRCVELSNKIESLETLRKKDERRIAEMREAAVRSESEKLERNEQLDRLKAEREDAYRTSQELSRSVEDLSNSKAELVAEVEQLQRALFTLEGELEHLKVSYITCNDKLADASEKNTNKDAIVAKFRSANRAANEMVATSEECLAQAKADLEDSETERKCLEERVAALEGELGATTDDFAAYERSMEEKLAERNDLTEVIQSTAEALKRTYEHKLSSMTKEHDARIEQVNRAVADFVTEFLAAYSQSQESLMRLGVTLSDADFNSQPDAQSWIDNIRFASEQIPRWEHIVVACFDVISAHQRQIEKAEEQIEHLASRAYRSKDTEAKIEAELREQHDRSLSIANELRFAEAKAAESAREITVMSKALIDTKKELARLYRLVEDQKDLKAKTEALIQERNDAESRSAEMSNTLASLNQKLEEATNASASLKCQIQDKDEAARHLQSKNATLDRKCERLRDYIRRLTSKCEEWAVSYEEQSKLLISVHSERRRLQKQDVTVNHADEETKSQERHPWSAERTMLHRVQSLVGEDLDEVASELRHFGLK